MRNVKIIADSSANVLETANVEYASIPMKIITSETEYTDNAKLDVEKMLSELEAYRGKASTSCPNMQDWLNAFGDAEEIFCITISSALSGSYNSACAAKAAYEEEYPGRRVFVLDSFSTGPEMALIIEKIEALISSGQSFDEICELTADYLKSGTSLLFMLGSMKNLANNGRVSHIVARAAGLLGIRIVGAADENGRLKLLDKYRGEKKALEAILFHMEESGFKGGKVNISHCINRTAAEELKKAIAEKYGKSEITVAECRGLCGFYAEAGGLIVGFERF